MSYPAPPWKLRGTAVQTLHLVDIDRVRSQIPPELDIVPVLPGKTLGGVYLATYTAGSSLEYHELIVVAAIVARRGKIGPWISHIYVDNPDSVAGGREIWGLPKELAEFTWNEQTSLIRVTQGGITLCQLTHQPPFRLWSQPIAAVSFGKQAEHLLWFAAQAHLHLGWLKAEVQIDSDSPFSILGLGQPWLAFYGGDLHLTVKPPQPLV